MRKAQVKFYFLMLKKFPRTHAPFIWSQINVKGYFLMFKKLNRNDAPFNWSQLKCMYSKK